MNSQSLVHKRGFLRRRWIEKSVRQCGLLGLPQGFVISSWTMLTVTCTIQELS